LPEYHCSYNFTHIFFEKEDLLQHEQVCPARKETDKENHEPKTDLIKANSSLSFEGESKVNWKVRSDISLPETAGPSLFQEISSSIPPPDSIESNQSEN
jgi:hypothetical protein